MTWAEPPVCQCGHPFGVHVISQKLSGTGHMDVIERDPCRSCDCGHYSPRVVH